MGRAGLDLVGRGLARRHLVSAAPFGSDGAQARPASSPDLPAFGRLVSAHDCQCDHLWLSPGRADGAGLRPAGDPRLGADAPAE